MSIFIVPSHESYRQRQAPASFGRCGGPASSSFSPFATNNAIPRSLFEALLANDGIDVDEDPGYTRMSAWEEHVEQLRRQEYLQEVQRRQRHLQARRQQQQLEQQRQRERVLRERAARVAWHREQQQRAVAQEYERRLQAYQQRQQQQHAERVKLANQYEHDWEQAAAQTLFGMINLAQHFFGGDDDEEQPDKVASGSGSKNVEKQTQEEKSKAAEDTVMGAGDEQVKTAADQHLAAQAEVAEEAKPLEAPGATPAAPSTEQDEAAVEGETQESNDRLIFTYPLPKDESTRSSIRAQDIHVSFDAPSRTIQLKGLWHNDTISEGASSTATSEQGDAESRGRKRSRSPKRSRVSDVDEKTGEEITKQEEEEDYVEVTKSQEKSSLTKAIRLPEDAIVDSLRAEITDEGFQVWVH